MRELSVCAGVTAYHPDETFHKRINAIAAQVTTVIIVDNGDNDLLARESFAANVEICLNRNVGAVAGALNIILSEARARGFEYLVTFDQDSVVPPNLVAALISAATSADAAIAGPNYFNATTHAPGRFNICGKRLLISRWFPRPAGIHQVYCVITSGMLLALRKLPQIIRYRDVYLVDLVDVDFCLQAKSQGLRIVVDTDVSMSHALGNRKVGSWRFSATNYAASRRYLATRNRIALWSQYHRKYWLFVVTDIAMAVIDVLRTLLLETNRWAQTKAYCTGMRDGFRLARDQK